MPGLSHENIEAQPLIDDDLQLISKPKVPCIRTWFLTLLLTATATASATFLMNYQGKY